MHMKRMKWAILLTAIAISLSACTGNNGETAPDPAPTPPPAAENPPAQDQQPNQDQTEPPATADQRENLKPTEPPAKLADLPETKELEVEIEGMTEKVPAKLTKSDQGYAFYLMEGFEFAMEEPGKDMIFFKNFPEYFARVEMVPADANAEDLKANAKEQLKANGNVIEMSGEQIHEMVRDEAKFFLHAGNSNLSQNIMLIETNGARLLVTMNIPNGEPAEGVTPRFFPMITSTVAAE